MREIVRYAIIGLALFSLNSIAYTQNNDNNPIVVRRTGVRKQENKKNGTKDISIRQQIFNDILNKHSDNIPWKRIVYRKLDLKSEANAPLYYPTTITKNDKNLFAIIFEAFLDHNIPVYEYQDGVEDFSNDTQMKVKDFLDRFQILYKTEQKGRDTTYIVEAADVPTVQVVSIYVKEEFYFNLPSGSSGHKILAICPIMNVIDSYGKELTEPLFWVKYEDIQPYISSSKIMLSSVNNAKNTTINDFFTLALYSGPIVKTENLLNQSIQQMCKTPKEVVKKEKEIEKSIQQFNDSLWVTNDSTWMRQDEQKIVNKRTNSRSKSVRGRRNVESSRLRKSGKSHDRSQSKKPKRVERKKSFARSVRGRG